MTNTIVSHPERARCLHCSIYIQPGLGLFCSDECRTAYAAAVAATLKPLTTRIQTRRERKGAK